MSHPFNMLETLHPYYKLGIVLYLTAEIDKSRGKICSMKVSDRWDWRNGSVLEGSKSVSCFCIRPRSA